MYIPHRCLLKYVAVLLFYSLCGLQPAGYVLCAGVPVHWIAGLWRPAELGAYNTGSAQKSGNLSNSVCQDFSFSSLPYVFHFIYFMCT